MILKDLKVEGFGAIIKPLEYQLDSPHIVIINGKNGAGKTTLINALVWVIFGKLLSKNTVVPWQKLQTKEYQGTKVELTLTKGNHSYQIIRCLDYTGKILGSKGKNRLILLKDGKMNSARNKKDVQKLIDKLIGLSFKIFSNSLVLGQNITRILDEKPEKQKEILSELFDTIFIDKAKELARKDLIELEKEFTNTFHQKELAEKDKENLSIRINYIQGTVEGIKTRKRVQLEELQGELADLKLRKEKAQVMNALHEENSQKILDLKNRQKKLQPLLDALLNLNQEEFKLSMGIKSDQGSIKDLETQIDHWKKSHKNNVCPYCGGNNTKMGLTKIKDNIKKATEDIANTKSLINKNQAKRNKLIAKIAKIKKAQIKHEKIKAEIRKIEIDLADMGIYRYNSLEIKKSITTIKEKIANLKRDNSDYEESKKELKNTQKELEITQQKYSKLKASSEYLEIRKNELHWLIKNPLSNKGLKSFIFNQLLIKLSNRAKYYAQFMPFNLQFKMDLESANKNLQLNVIWNTTKTSIPYLDLSGGEKQLVNIVASLCIHDIISSKGNNSIMFMDEIFENLDKTNTQIISDLISVRAENQHIHLITHKSDFILYNTKIITLRKNKQGQTELE